MTIPPLRRREGDIILLSKFFFEKNLGEKYINYTEIFYKIMKEVEDYQWYGNIRELQNFVERICVLLKYHGDSYNFNQLVSDFLIKKEDCDSCDTEGENVSKTQSISDININLNDWEVNRIISALKKNDLSVQKTAEELGVSRTTLWRKMKKYNINL